LTVKALVALLSKMPPEAAVVVIGYEAGVDDVIEIIPCRIQREVHTEWYNGKHEIDPQGEMAAVLIAGPKREAA